MDQRKISGNLFEIHLVRKMDEGIDMKWTGDAFFAQWTTVRFVRKDDMVEAVRTAPPDVMIGCFISLAELMVEHEGRDQEWRNRKQRELSLEALRAEYGNHPVVLQSVALSPPADLISVPNVELANMSEADLVFMWPSSPSSAGQHPKYKLNTCDAKNFEASKPGSVLQVGLYQEMLHYMMLQEERFEMAPFVSVWQRGACVRSPSPPPRSASSHAEPRGMALHSTPPLPFCVLQACRTLNR